MLNGKPRGGLGSGDEGNKVICDVGSGEGVGALDEGERVVGELGVVAGGSNEAGRVVRGGGRHGDSELANGTVECGREVDEDARH